jgi:nucleoside transporter
MGPPPAGLGFNGHLQGIIFSLMPLATIFATPYVGQLADRKINSEVLLGILSLLGAVFLFGLAQVTEFNQFAGLMLAFSICYAPTLALTNSIVFSHLSDSEKQFGGIRVAGTIGWIIAGWALSTMQGSLTPIKGDLFLLAAGFSVALGLLAFALPKTPPARQGTNPFAFLEALQMLKNRDFLVFMACAFVVGTELEFYYLHTGAFLGAPVDLKGIGVPGAEIARTMSIGQIAEIVVMLMLPLFVKWLGMRNVIVLGIIAWPIRYLIFALAPSQEWARNLVVPSLALHGFCYVFFFVAGFIYVDKVAPSAIRASAQALVALVVLGLGRFVGSLVAGSVQGFNTVERGAGLPPLVHWDRVFMVPVALTVLCAIIFPLLFRGSDDRKIEVGGPMHA